MRAIKEEFPNPVLAAERDDYIEECRFYTSFSENDISVDTDDIFIPIKYVLECKGLQKLIELGDAVVTVLIKSSAASYRRLYKFAKGENEMTIAVPKYSVINKMELTGSIIAAHDIKEFSCDGEFNELYFGTSTFEIRKGDILATEESRSIYVDDSELEKPISSIFSIKRCEEQEQDIIPIFEDHKIEICLNKELNDLYHQFKDFNNGALRRYLTGIVVYPVLIEALTYLRAFFQGEDVEVYRELRWFRTIEKKAEKLGIDLASCEDSYTTIANRLLGGISLDALKSFKNTLDNEINSGETQMLGGMD